MKVLTIVAATVMIGCLSVAALATGWVILVLVIGADGWEQLFALLGLGIAGLALLAALPHALILRWARRHPRSIASPWPTLVAALCTAAPIPATVLYFFEKTPAQYTLLAAVLMVLLAAEVALMLRVWWHPQRVVWLNSR